MARSTDGPVRPPPIGYVARATLVVLGLWGLANVVWLGRDLFFIAFLAVLFASFLDLPVRPLERRGVPRVVSAPVVLLLCLGALAAFVVLSLPVLREQVGTLRQELPRAIEGAFGWVERTAATLGLPGGENANMDRAFAEVGDRLITGALPILGSVVGVATGLLAIVFGGLYLAIESRLFVNGAVSLVPVSGRERARGALEIAGHNLRRWLLGTFIAMALVGALTGVGLVILDVPAALALAVLAGLLEFIPVLGPVIASVPAIAIALVVSPVQAFWVTLLYVVVQQIESNLISPLVMKGVVRLPPALSLLFQLLMTILFGFVGLMIAVPLLAVIVVLVKNLYVEPMEARYPPATDP
jgi:predicted PurR-regulated permease PerM